MLLGVAIAGAPVVSALAQAPAEEPTEVVVTGSRIVRDGMTAPTPVTVLGADRLEQRAISNVGDMLSELPSFRASSTPATGATAGYVGGRILDLRGLGSVRTLVLVDGKRFVPSTTQGTVDTNLIPSILLERAEVVTGGASAAYGSDAVAGVVNFILNDRMEGLRTSAEYGISNYSDNQNYTAKVAGGMSLWDGRGHFIGAVEYENSKGVDKCSDRDWCAEQWGNFGRPAGLYNNPAESPGNMPSNSILAGQSPSTLSPTGVINGVLVGASTSVTRGTTGLYGIAFNADGSPRRFGYGFPVNNQNQVGGENRGTNAYLYGGHIVSPIERYTVYTRTRFDFTDSLTGKMDLSFGHVEGENGTRQLLDVGYVIRRDNPFIPTSTNPALNVRGILDANPNITALSLGRNFAEYGFVRQVSKNDATRGVFSLEGELTDTWKWDAYYQVGRNDFRADSYDIGINSRVAAAMDVTTSGGVPVCRINVDANPNNNDANCIPLNPFGSQLDPRLAGYLLGDAFQTAVTTENVVAANANGELFSTWAGPISAATGLEYRQDKIAGEADPISQQLGFYTANTSAISGKIKVAEAYLETIIPLAKEVTMAENLEVNGAIRRTKYDRDGSGVSSEVYATTWKGGFVWEPIEMLRFRGTKSRDIRAPNVSELFGPTTRGFSIINDPNPGASGITQANPATIGGSNPNLAPEKADTVTLGFVIQPKVDGFLGRMQLSVDHFDIDIHGAIGTLGAQNIVTRCFQGATEYCSLITRNPNGSLAQIVNTQANVDEVITKGYDLEFSYRQPLDSWGDLDFRLLATYATDLTTYDSAGSINRVGQTGLRAGTPGGVPDYTLDGLLHWSRGPLDLSLHSRYIPAGIYTAGAITPEDPGYLPTLATSANTNHVRNATYIDLNAQYDFSAAGDGSLVGFVGGNNLTNQDTTRTGGSNGTGNNVLFDAVGRTYKVGVRMKF